jgi:hypothetical protein
MIDAQAGGPNQRAYGAGVVAMTVSNQIWYREDIFVNDVPPSSCILARLAPPG